MNAIKFFFAALVAIVIVVLAVANGAPVEVRAWPDLTNWGVPAPPVFAAPLFVVGVACGLVGFLLGAAREYVRERGVRAEAREKAREAALLKAKVEKLTEETGTDDLPPGLPAR